MIWKQSVAILVIALPVAVALGLSFSQDPVVQPTAPRQPALVQQFVGGGHWNSDSDAANARGWQTQLAHFDDDSLTGRITLTGPTRLSGARLEGQISGNEVTGVLVGDNDMQVGTFTGSIYAESVSGTYTTADGDSGTWSWDGPLPDAPAVAPTPNQVQVSPIE
jgi:hypothetical protein